MKGWDTYSTCSLYESPAHPWVGVPTRLYSPSHGRSRTSSFLITSEIHLSKLDVETWYRCIPQRSREDPFQCKVPEQFGNQSFSTDSNRCRSRSNKLHERFDKQISNVPIYVSTIDSSRREIQNYIKVCFHFREPGRISHPGPRRNSQIRAPGRVSHSSPRRGSRIREPGRISYPGPRRGGRAHREVSVQLLIPRA